MAAMVAQMTPDLSLAKYEAVPETRPYPLLVCWAIWVVASVTLWVVVLRAALWLF